jgi:hypothetical protein
MSGLGAERTALDDVTFARRDSVLIEDRRVEIPVDRGQIFEAEFISAVCAVPQTSYLHEKTSRYTPDSGRHRNSRPRRCYGLASPIIAPAREAGDL